MSMGFRIPRLDVFSLTWEKADIYIDSDDDKVNPESDDDEVYPDSPTDVTGLCRIFLSDGFRLHEIYNPVNVKDFFIDLRELKMQHSSDSFQKSPKQRRLDSVSGHNTDLPLQTDQLLCAELEVSEGDSISGPIGLPLMGPDGDIRPYGTFNFILHQDTGDELLKKAMPNYRRGFTAKPGAVKSAAITWRLFDYDKPFRCYFARTFGTLTLDCIAFRNSRLVTVSVKWLMDDIVNEKILEDIGGDGKKNDGTVTYICGNISFYGHAYEKKSILVETPEDRVIKVVHGGPIRLLRSIVAVPYMSSFRVEASLLDPINNNFDVNNFASFDLPEENILHELTRPIFGNGANLEVEVSVKPNDLDQDELGVDHTGEFWL